MMLFRIALHERLAHTFRVVIAKCEGGADRQNVRVFDSGAQIYGSNPHSFEGPRGPSVIRQAKRRERGLIHKSVANRKQNKCYRKMFGISYRVSNKRICMSTGQYPCRTSGAFTANRQASQAIMVRPCLSTQYAAEDHTTRNSGRQTSQTKTSSIMEGHNIKEWTGQSMSSLLRIADDRGRWAVIAADASVCWSTQRRLDVMGIS